MRKLLLIGVGAGDPGQITAQAIEALGKVDVVFAFDKGPEKDDLAALREDICRSYMKGRPYRTIAAPDPERDRAPASYETAVSDWHERRAELFETMIAENLGPDECGALLIWGDPALYDSTLRIVRRVLARGLVAFDYKVIPGVSSVQALAAAHRISLHEIGEPVLITTGRNIAHGLPDGFANVVVMLDGHCAFNAFRVQEIDIYWGAYLGTKDEILISGDLRGVASEIEQTRAAARARKGWIMDIYLLKRRKNA